MFESEKHDEAFRLVTAFSQIEEKEIRQRLIAIAEAAALNKRQTPLPKEKDVTRKVPVAPGVDEAPSTGLEHTLIYVSHSNSALHDGPSSEVIQGILAQSRARNATRGVTGALLFTGVCFCQVLEGDRTAVDEIFDSILRDGRHRNISLLSLRPTSKRLFPKWSMAYAGATVDPDASAWLRDATIIGASSVSAPPIRNASIRTSARTRGVTSAP